MSGLGLQMIPLRHMWQNFRNWLKTKETSGIKKFITILMIGEMGFQKMLEAISRTQIIAREDAHGIDEIWHKAISREAIELTRRLLGYTNLYVSATCMAAGI